MLVLKPIHRAALTSCCLMGLGDATCQVIQAQRQQKPVQVDFARAARFSLIGLTLHGPFFFKGFQMLDGKFGTAATLKNAATKVLAGQVTLFPTYTTLVLLYASLLEGQGLEQGMDKIQHKLPQLFVSGSVYWPAVNMVNFLYVPPTQRVLAVNVCALAWNAYLSFVNADPIPQSKLAAAS